MDLGLLLLAQFRDPLLLILLGATVLNLLLLFALLVRTGRMNKRYRQFMSGMAGKNLEEMLLEDIRLVKAAVHRADEVEMTCRRLEGITAQCLQGVGVVRYNAFQDVGSDLSFAVALLDRQGNGVVFSSLYGREDTRTYAKPVKEGQSTYPLTAEEKAAIKKAYESQRI